MSSQIKYPSDAEAEAILISAWSFPKLIPKVIMNPDGIFYIPEERNRIGFYAKRFQREFNNVARRKLKKEILKWKS